MLFGDQGRERVAYEVEAVHDDWMSWWRSRPAAARDLAGGRRGRRWPEAAGQRVAGGDELLQWPLVQGGVQAADLIDMLAVARPDTVAW